MHNPYALSLGYLSDRQSLNTKNYNSDYLNNQKQSAVYYDQLDAWVAEFEVVYNVEAITAAGGTVPAVETDAE